MPLDSQATSLPTELKPWTISLENCFNISFIVRQSIVHHFTLTSVLLLLITLSLIFIGRLDIFIARALTHLSRIIPIGFFTHILTISMIFHCYWEMPQNKFKREYVGGKELSDDLINLIMCDIVQNYKGNKVTSEVTRGAFSAVSKI